MAATSEELAAGVRTCGPRRMAVIRTIGDPAETAGHTIGNLYAVVYALRHVRAREGRDFDVGAVSAQWPNAHLAPRHEWLGVWGLEVPADVADDELPVGDGDQQVELETWPGGEFAEIVHRGPYATERETIDRLHRFVEASGYALDGPHEEQYLTRPDAEDPATRIRYRVKPVA